MSKICILCKHEKSQVALFILPESKKSFRKQIINSVFCRSQFIKAIFFTCHWVAMSNGCYNPFVYAIFSVSYIIKLRHIYKLFDDFQENFKKELKKKAVCSSLRKKVMCCPSYGQQHVVSSLSQIVAMNVINQDLNGGINHL